MILGNVALPVSCVENIARIGDQLKQLYSLPRFYCGPHNLNLLVDTVSVVADMSWVKDVVAAVSALVAERYPEHTDVRETVLCSCGPGNSGKPFFMRNYLDAGVRAHVIVTPRGGTFKGRREIKYGPSDVLLFTAEDSGETWTNTYDKHAIQLCIVFMSTKDADKSNWKLFAEHAMKGKR